MDAALLRTLARTLDNTPGDVIEIGVYQGDSAELLCQLFPDRTVYLCDTFCGMPATGPLDGHREGDFRNTSVEAVEKVLSDHDNYEIHAGLFPETATAIKERTFCFAHVDCDLQKSVRDSCEFCYLRMERGGIMMLDDYGFGACRGAKVAVDEFFADKPEPLNHRGQRVFVIKR